MRRSTRHPTDTDDDAGATLVLPVVAPEAPGTAASDVEAAVVAAEAAALATGDQAVVVIPAPRKPAPRKKRTLRVARPAPGPDAPRVLAIQGLVKKFGDNTAVDGISLDVRAGSFFGIVGPNGAGKTTTLSMVTGLLRPDAGTVRINDIDAWADPRAAKRATGALPDRLRLFDRLTGAQLLYYSGVLRGLDHRTVRERSTDLIAAFGLEDAVDRLVADYSAGMTKKIALACAMIHAPRLLVLDEPFESVDPVSAANLTEILERYVEGGGTVVLSSHGMDLIERVCDSAAIIVGGRVLASGTLDEVRAGQHPRRPLRRARRRTQGSGRHGMVAQFLRLKLRLLGNIFRRSPWQVVGISLGLVYGARDRRAAVPDPRRACASSATSSSSATCSSWWAPRPWSDSSCCRCCSASTTPWTRAGSRCSGCPTAPWRSASAWRR